MEEASAEPEPAPHIVLHTQLAQHSTASVARQAHLCYCVRCVQFSLQHPRLLMRAVAAIPRHI
jgi:hypothetical protein